MVMTIATHLGELKVLIVEDEPQDVRIVRRAVPRDFQVHVAHSLDAARDYIHGEDGVPDVALVDIGLPDGSGLDLIGELEPSPVVMLTGQDEPQLVSTALSRGAQDYIPKHTVTPDGLIRAVGLAIERKRRAQLQLQVEHNQRLQQLGLMAGSIAHEIGNPATFVHSNLELLNHDLGMWADRLDLIPAEILGLGGFGGPVAERLLEAKAMVAEALAGVDRIHGLVKQLRNFTRPEPVGPDTEPPVVDLVEVVHTAIAVAGARVRESARIVTSFPPEPVLVTGHAHRISQVVSNFLLNAVQAIEARGPERGTVEVNLEGMTNFVVVSVVDDGLGVPDELDIERLFQPFVTTRHGTGGTGLGLAISMQVARSLGGYIDIHRRMDGPGVEAELVVPALGGAPLMRPMRAT